MRDTNILLLVIAALLALGGFLVTVGLDSGRLESGPSRPTSCERALSDWDAVVCVGVAEGRYTTHDVLTYPSWDWEAIGAGRVRVGMTTRMVEAAWGPPDFINANGYGEHDEEWAANGHLLGFRNGSLAAMEEAQIWSVDRVLSAAKEDVANYELRTTGRRVFLAGRISDVVSELDGSPRVEFEISDGWDEIRCAFAPEAYTEATVLRVGETVVLLGVGDGMGLFGPTFTSCRVFAK